MGTEIGASNVRNSVEMQHAAALNKYLAEIPLPEAAYDKSQILVALYRLSQSEKEAKDILAAYEHTVQGYMGQISLVKPDDSPESTAI
jgi:hypothetical protein